MLAPSLVLPFVITLIGVQRSDFMGCHLSGWQLFSVIFSDAAAHFRKISLVGQVPHRLTGHTAISIPAIAVSNNASAAVGCQLTFTFVGFPLRLTNAVPHRRAMVESGVTRSSPDRTTELLADCRSGEKPVCISSDKGRDPENSVKQAENRGTGR